MYLTSVLGDLPNLDLNLSGFMNQEKQQHCCFVQIFEYFTLLKQPCQVWMYRVQQLVHSRTVQAFLKFNPCLPDLTKTHTCNYMITTVFMRLTIQCSSVSHLILVDFLVRLLRESGEFLKEKTPQILLIQMYAYSINQVALQAPCVMH